MISSALLQRIMKEVALPSALGGVAGRPDEKCGILRGRGGHILHADRTANIAADPFTRFEIDPASLIRAYKLARKPNGLEVLGFYHTHPVGTWDPSAEDARCAAPDGKLWLIASQDGAKLWRAVPRGQRHGRFDPVIFDMVVGKRVDEGVPAVRWRGWDADVRVTRTEPPFRSEHP